MIIQAINKLLVTPQRTALKRLVAPTPIIAPVIVWVVLTGIPICSVINKVIAPAVSAALLAGTISASHAPSPGEADDEFVKAFKKINDDFNKGPDKRWDNNVLQGMNIGYLTTSALLGAGKDLTRPGIISYIEANAAKLSSAALSPLGYSAKTHEAYTGFWIGKYDATAVLKPIDATRKVWTTDSAKGAVSELKYTRPAIAADALPKVG